MRAAVGNTVTYPGAPGLGRVAAVDGDHVRVDFFESAAEPVVGSTWQSVESVRRVPLSKETRVFFTDGSDRWIVGRIVGGGPEDYFVRVPNLDHDIDVHEARLRVRWEKRPNDPLQVLLTGANETPRYRDVREPVRRLLLAERAATGSVSAVGSSGINLHAHQVGAALRILRDPVQRYLLADEVGMGKTIQAGLVIRQTLIDAPGRSVGVIAPDPLTEQWRAELRDKFFLDDFPTESGEAPYRVTGHDDPSGWAALADVDILVVDEAHLLARTSGPFTSPYRELAAVAHAVPRLLMLSATPFSRGAATHLALLHLLDPDLFRWEEMDAFTELLDARRELALAVFGLDDPDPDNPELLELQFEDIKELVPEDHVLQQVMGQTVDLLRSVGAEDPERVARSLDAVRTHISETYRLHHRVIRNRRHVIERQRLDEDGLLTPFEFTGRTRPKPIRLHSEEANLGARVLGEWVAGCEAAVLDEALDPGPYAAVLATLQSRVGGPTKDLQSVLRYRIDSVQDPGALTPAEKAILDAAPVLPFERDLLDVLGTSDYQDGLAELAQTLVKLSMGLKRLVIFCGTGALATDLGRALPAAGFSKAWIHTTAQTEQVREEATAAWRQRGGLLVCDASGDVGRNLQEADVAFHIRLSGQPNALEQRIGRVDRYGQHSAAQTFIATDDDPAGVGTAWVKLLANGFGIFSTSISALQEAADDLAHESWTELIRSGVEAFVGTAGTIREALAKERKRINELDALEASFAAQGDNEDIVRRVATYEADVSAIERPYRRLIEGAEGFKFASRANPDGTIRFDVNEGDRPLLSSRLLGRLNVVDAARVGSFDRWRLPPGRRIFRRGNPFIDGIESLLDVDDRGQAAAMWRLNRSWPGEPLAHFGFDFLVEADADPILAVLKEHPEAEPVARRRADAAFAPQHQRVWIPVHTREPIVDDMLIKYLSQPLEKMRDVNLGRKAGRIRALHTILGGADGMESIARACFNAARSYLDEIADLTAATEQAAARVRRDTDVLIAQSRARARAAGLVTDPSSFDDEVRMGQAIETGVLTPSVRLSGVVCVVVSAQSWSDYV
ncbi:putative type III restriction enzyme, res subunit [Nocardioidaceae bacterium Broad-1]|nr:putative type III restriction enzyme, res subunit [Nocardioidaceae bacterium Broad-1]